LPSATRTFLSFTSTVQSPAPVIAKWMSVSQPADFSASNAPGSELKTDAIEPPPG